MCDKLDQLLTDRDVEALTGRSRSTLQKDRVAGSGIPFVRIGRLVRYRPADVAEYLARLPVYRSTTEADAAVSSIGRTRVGAGLCDPKGRRDAEVSPPKTNTTVAILSEIER